jgi:uncharacterized membrane protein YqjE
MKPALREHHFIDAPTDFIHAMNPIKSATNMFSTIQKSKQVSLIALERVSDYFELLRVEMKIREQAFGMRLAGYTVAVLFAMLATIFLGIAIIVSFWDSDYRALAAWFVVALYAGIAVFSVRYCMKLFQPESIAGAMRTQLRRDMQAIKESV